MFDGVDAGANGSFGAFGAVGVHFFLGEPGGVDVVVEGSDAAVLDVPADGGALGVGSVADGGVLVGLGEGGGDVAVGGIAVAAGGADGVDDCEHAGAFVDEPGAAEVADGGEGGEGSFGNGFGEAGELAGGGVVGGETAEVSRVAEFDDAGSWGDGGIGRDGFDAGAIDDEEAGGRRVFDWPSKRRAAVRAMISAGAGRVERRRGRRRMG